MIRTILLSTAILSGLALGGCGNTQNERAVNGALLGGVAGAVIGGAAGGRVGGALAGGVIGAAGGAIIAGATAPRPRCARISYDYYGNQVCTAYYQ